MVHFIKYHIHNHGHAFQLMFVNLYNICIHVNKMSATGCL